MRPYSTTPVRSTVPAGNESEFDDTVSYSDSEEADGDPPILQQLAVALIAWEPTLVAAYARLDQAAAGLAPFALFLACLHQEVGRWMAMRGEIIGWLQALARDDAARTHAFGVITAANGAGTALATYQAIRRAADQ